MSRPFVKSFFSYYGAKHQLAAYYPAPQHRRLVEPFAGSAAYSLRYHFHSVELIDVDPVIAGLWLYLTRVKEREIMLLPDRITHVDELPDHVCQEARWLIGFWVNLGTAAPCKQPSKWMRDADRPDMYWGEAIKRRISSQLRFIRHWKVTQGSYDLAEQGEATWFIDPPYNNKAGTSYKHHDVDYSSLGLWCRTRRGQVIVCENQGADWLPFEHLTVTKAGSGSTGHGFTREAVWLG